MRIGHASIDENGKFADGKAGDQTKKEVCIREWYNKPWNIMLRCKDSKLAEEMAIACEKACNNNNIGYDQNERNTLKIQARKVEFNLDKINVPCECDCSSLMTVCAECAGIQIPYNGNNAPTTNTMKNAFLNTGLFDVFTDVKYLTKTEYLKRGDILIKEGSHTVMVLDNGSMTMLPSNTIKAIDLSKYNVINNYIDLSKQINHVIIRIGYRSYESGKLVEDISFKTHISQCKANKMNVGIYFYDQSINESEAIEQAIWVVNTLKPYNIDLPIYIDSEYSNKNHNGRADNISKEQRTKNILAFCNKISELGYMTGVYASDSWFKTMLIFDKIKYLNIWCARYSTNKPTIEKYDIWQYGSETFNWADGAIDVNYIYNLPTNTQTIVNKAENAVNKDIKINNVVNVNTYLNIRSLPIANGAIIGKLYNGNNIEIFGYIKDWYAIDNKLSKWVSSKYIITNMVITTENLHYRTDAGKDNQSLGVFNKGTVLKVLNTKNDWYLCLDDKDRFGWCSGQYLNIKNNI